MKIHLHGTAQECDQPPASSVWSWAGCRSATCTSIADVAAWSASTSGSALTALQPRTGRASRSATFPERAAPRRPGAAQTVTCLPLHGASKARPRRRPLVDL